MSEHVEFRLIAKIVQDGNFRDVLKGKMTPKMFSVPAARIMFEDIWTYYHNPKHPGKVPRARWMKERSPSYKDFRHIPESVPELCEEIRKAAIARRLIDVTRDVAAGVADDTYGTLDRVRTGILQIQSMTATSRDVLLNESGEELIREYLLMQESEGITGVPYPWDALNKETNGMLPEEFIVLYGRLKSMKTFVGCHIATNAYYFGDRRVMFYSAEMGPKQISKRIACSLCAIDYKAYKQGRLPPDQEDNFFTVMRELDQYEKQDTINGHRPALLITSDKDDTHSIGGVGHIRAKAEEFEPDLIVVDSYYRLRDDRTGRNDYDWKVQAGIAQDLKHLAQQLQVPILGISQANRTSANKEVSEGMEDASYTDATGQEADLGMRVVKGERRPEGTELKIVIAAAREIEAYGFTLNVRPFTRFSFGDWLMPPVEQDPVTDKAPRTKVKKEQLQSMTPRELKSARSKIDKAADQIKSGK